MSQTNSRVVASSFSAYAPLSASNADPMSRRWLWAGRLLTAFPALFLLVDGIMKFFDIPQAVAGMNQLGWAPSLAPMLGVVLLSCLALYAFPRTAVLGAVLLTGYLGGAVATQVRVGNPILSHVLLPVYVAVMLWGGLWFRDARLRALMPLRGGAD